MTETLIPGTNTPGRPFFSEGGCWRRRDTYISTFDGQAITELRFAAGKDDRSPVYKHWEPGKYNSHCHHCWLGFSHTVYAHAQAVRRWSQSDAQAESAGECSDCYGSGRAGDVRKPCLYCGGSGRQASA